MPAFKYAHCHPLTVDNDRDYTALLRRSFERIGVPRSQIHSCGDGEEAVRHLSLEASVPSFTLLDLNLPRQSGLDVLRWIRSQPKVANHPVFMLTSSVQGDDVQRAFRLGVGSYFVKPLEGRELEAMLEGIVAYWQRRSRTPAIPHQMLTERT